MQPDEERQALTQLAERMRERFPDTPPDNIDKVVAEVAHEFDGSPIRDFIPVLVERAVVDRFRVPQHA